MNKPPPRSKGRRAADELLPVNHNKSESDDYRNSWIEQVCKNFISTGKSNREYYKVILETLWPPGHQLPGPLVTEDHIRQAIDEYRRSGGKSVKAYKDPFRRVRELIGEEGLSILKNGKTFQLSSIEVKQKRAPRTKLSAEDWNIVLEEFGRKCLVCGRPDSEVNLQQDHRVPRTRTDIPRGGEHIDNFQPLCDECNIKKSTLCRGCKLNCSHCSWAFPEIYSPILVSDKVTLLINEEAKSSHLTPSELVNKILLEYIKKNI